MTEVVSFSAPVPARASAGTAGQDRVAITTPHRQALLDELRGLLRGGQGFSLATLNLDHIVKLGRNPAFKAAYLAHSHVVADGNPIVWLSKLAGREVELIPGSELIAPLAVVAAEEGIPVGLVGSTPEVLDLAATRMEADHPGLRVPLRISPPMGFDPAGPAADALIAQIGASEAKLVFLALGAPKQEILAARAAAALPDRGFVSIGAGLDFIAGAQKRAPVWVRKLALEWVWRMLGNPRRLAKRYGECILVMPGLALSALRERKRG